MRGMALHGVQPLARPMAIADYTQVAGRCSCAPGLPVRQIQGPRRCRQIGAVAQQRVKCCGAHRRMRLLARLHTRVMKDSSARLTAMSFLMQLADAHAAHAWRCGRAMAHPAGRPRRRATLSPSCASTLEESANVCLLNVAPVAVPQKYSRWPQGTLRGAAAGWTSGGRTALAEETADAANAATEATALRLKVAGGRFWCSAAASG